MPLWLREKLWIGSKIETELRAPGLRAARQALVRRAPREPRGVGLLPVAVRRAARPHLRRRRGVGHLQHRRGPGPRGRDGPPAQLPELARPPLLGLHLLLRVPGELRRVQADGPRPLRRAPLRRRHPRHLIDLHDDGSFTVNRRYFDYLASLRMTNGRFDERLRRPAAGAGVRAHPAGDGPGPLDPGGHRGGRAAHGPDRGLAHRRATGRAGRRRRPQLRGQRPAAAGGPVRRPLGPARGGRRRGRGGRRALGLAPGARQRAHGRPPRRHAGLVPRPGGAHTFNVVLEGMDGERQRRAADAAHDDHDIKDVAHAAGRREIRRHMRIAKAGPPFPTSS